MSSTAKDLWPPLFLLAAPAPAPAACLLIAGKETTERKREKERNNATGPLTAWRRRGGERRERAGDLKGFGRLPRLLASQKGD